MLVTVNNFDLIKNHLTFDSPDDFYFVQVFVRGKDGRTANVDGGPMNSNNKNRMVRIWTIRSLDEFEHAKYDIISIANSVGGRAYIHPTKRSFKDVARECLRLSTETYLSENYDGMKTAYARACGVSYNKKDKKFLVDIDWDDFAEEIATYLYKGREDLLNNVRMFIDSQCEPYEGESKILYEVPTLHGIHLITKPFNVKKFHDRFPKIVVHKNNPTLLYYTGECKYYETQSTRPFIRELGLQISMLNSDESHSH